MAEHFATMLILLERARRTSGIAIVTGDQSVSYLAANSYSQGPMQ